MMKLSSSISPQALAKYSQRGWTLPEMLVAVGIGSLLLAAIGSATVFSVRSFASMYNFVAMDAKSRSALDNISRDVRGATSVASSSASKLVLNGAKSTLITYTWDPILETVTCAKKTSKGTTIGTNLTHCTGWSVTMYDTSYAVTTDPTKCKTLAMNWTCSRSVIGVRQTNEAQQAMIVLRNKQP
jgi:prepilin-type N-terminal cleavage/methylation domain-containing protein